MSYVTLIDEVSRDRPDVERDAIAEVVELVAGLKAQVTRADVEAWLSLADAADVVVRAFYDPAN
jgi:hypothetical protein